MLETVYAGVLVLAAVALTVLSGALVVRLYRGAR